MAHYYGFYILFSQTVWAWAVLSRTWTLQGYNILVKFSSDYLIPAF